MELSKLLHDQLDQEVFGRSFKCSLWAQNGLMPRAPSVQINLTMGP